MDKNVLINALYHPHPGIEELKILISPGAMDYLEEMAVRAKEITRLRFGKTIFLYNPLYISNECINQCIYCGFNAKNKILRVTLTIDEIIKEAEELKKQGFEHILLLTGEAPNKVPLTYLKEVILAVKKVISQVSIEIYPLDESGYRELSEAGCDGITIYQETYNREIYKIIHPAGPKKDFDKRYNTPLYAAKAGLRGVGLGFLLGLTPWREEILKLYEHGKMVLKADWRVKLAFSFPRLRPHEGGFKVKYPVSDRELAQMIFAFRVLFPDGELVLSTRESKSFRDGLIGLGITRISAGSSTQPGGYTSVKNAGEQFEISDNRTPSEIAKLIEEKGFEPVWKDWDWSFDS
jgi:2-iminoacetate synthase